MSALATDTKLLLELVNDLDKSAKSEDDLDVGLTCYRLLGQAAGQLATLRAELASRLGADMDAPQRTVMGAGVFKRHAKRASTPKCMDEEGLWRLVLDTRIVDPDTAEIMPQAEVIRRVYGAESKESGLVRLTGASPSKLEAVGIPADLFFEKGDPVGWTLEVVG